MRGEDFEYGLGIKPKPAPAKKEPKKVSDEVAPDDDDDDEMASDVDWNSEDDPERLWCVCQQPHNNRFMICCDSCLDWFHGKCVGITKKVASEMEEKGNEWTCPKCKDNKEPPAEKPLTLEKKKPVKKKPVQKHKAAAEAPVVAKVVLFKCFKYKLLTLVLLFYLFLVRNRKNAVATNAKSPLCPTPFTAQTTVSSSTWPKPRSF